MTESEELAEKYQRLFQDYSRIKAQHSVLKKAVVKEQAENAVIQAAMKEKEQEARKSLQQLDLLSFHNQRLTKRIENLQDSISTKSGGSWLLGGGGSTKKELEKSQADLEAATIDLESKIEENEKLHQQLYEINALYPRHVTELKGKIESLESRNQELQLDVERAGMANEDTITLIRKERMEIEKELGAVRDSLQNQLTEEKQETERLTALASKLQADVDRLSKAEELLEELRVKHKALQEEVETFKWISSELSQLQQSYSSLEQDKIKMEKAQAQLMLNNTTLKQSEETLRKALAQQEKRAATFAEQGTALQSTLTSVKSDAEKKQREYKENVDKLESDLLQARKAHDEIQEQYRTSILEAEQTAKVGESKQQAGHAAELLTIKAKLDEANTRVQALEEIKEKLELELKETKFALEQMHVKPDSSLKNGSSESTHVNEGSTAHEDGSTTEDGPATEEESTEAPKVPLSKKARKKKAAAAAAAAAAATAKAEKAAKEKANEDQHATSAPSKDPHALHEAAVIAAAASATAAATEAATAAAAIERETATNELQKEIDALKAQMREIEAANSTKELDLKNANATLESLKDEKQSLSSSLEMHVEMTMLLQQEVETMRQEKEIEMRRTAAVRASSANSMRTSSPRVTDQKEKTLPKPPTPVPLPPSAAPETKETATQMEAVKVKDQGIQLEQPVMEDESTLTDVVLTAEIKKSVHDKESVATSTADVGTATNASATMVDESTATSPTHSPAPSGPSKRSTLDEKDLQGLTLDNNANQLNREHLIKKHYETKIQNLTEKIQLSDGRYVRLHREFGLLEELFRDEVGKKAVVVADCEKWKFKVEQLEEELRSVKAEYQVQMDNMSSFMNSLQQQR